MTDPATTDSGGRLRRASPFLFASLLTVTGSSHFAFPKAFASIVPPQLPWTYGLVYASGVAELACAAGVAVPRTRRVAGWAAAALLVAVFPANVQMALDAGGRSDAYRWGTYARLPVQAPLFLWAVSVARSASGGRSTPVSAVRTTRD
jgi:uncharacterized membrane protein